MRTYTFNEYLDMIGDIIEQRTHLIWNTNNNDWYVSLYYKPLEWHLHINKESFRELYDLNSSAEYGYYCARRQIETHFAKVLYKNESQM